MNEFRGMRDAYRTWRLGMAGLFALALLLLAGPQAAHAHAGHHHHQPAKRIETAAKPLILARASATTAAEAGARMAAPMASGGGTATAPPPAPVQPFALDDTHPSLDLARLIGEAETPALKAPKADCQSGEMHSGIHHLPAGGHDHGDAGATCCCLAHCAVPGGLAAVGGVGPSQGPVANVLPMPTALRDGIAHSPRLRPPQTSG